MALPNSKNLSPAGLSVMAAGTMALINLGFSLLVPIGWPMRFGILLISFALSYWLFYYMVNRFVFRKIKLLYKLIYTTKASKKEAYFQEHILPPKTLEEVEKDVVRWADQRSREIERFQANEQFRKEFLANLAHELRTPLFTVQGYVDTLLGGALDDHEVREKFLKNTSRGIDRLVRLVDDIEEISRLETGNITLEKENFPIQDLFAEVYEEFSLLAENQHISLLRKKGTEWPLSVHADRAKIRQVLVNLVENAIKYNHRGGSVTAGCYAIDGDHVFVEISDTGQGIGEEHIPRIFERFYRAEKSRSRRIGGTGLGLSIVKHIIEAHGHTLTVRSRPGVGTSMGFTLDKARESA